MVKTYRLILAVLAIALLGSDTAFTRGYVYSHIGSTFQWSGSAQSWSGSTQAVSCTDWTTYIRNDGTACTANALIGLTWAQAHAVTSVTHTPILANNTFNIGGFGSWSGTTTGGCTGSTFVGANTSSDEDGDSGASSASGLSCTVTAAVLNLVQTFSISGTPTSQTYSFWYRAPSVTVGDAVNCSQGSGSVSLALALNGNTVTTISNPTLDNAWHEVTGSATQLVNGSNTLTISATLKSATGQNSVFNTKIGDYTCRATIGVQTMQIDNVKLSAVW